MTQLPYTQSVIDRVYKEVEQTQLELPTFTNDFNAGIRYAKEAILKAIKEVKP